MIIPVIGRKGYTTSFTPLGGEIPSRVIIHGQKYRLNFLIEGIAYGPAKKDSVWVGDQVRKRKIVPAPRPKTIAFRYDGDWEGAFEKLREQMAEAMGNEGDEEAARHVEGDPIELFEKRMATFREPGGLMAALLKDAQFRQITAEAELRSAVISAVFNATIEPDEGDVEATGDQEQPPEAINSISREDVVRFSHSLDQWWPNSLDRYQEIATKSAIYPGKGTPFGLMYAALGLAEAGEVQNKVKKLFRDDNVITIATDRGDGSHDVLFGEVSPERRMEIIKELGGALWYISAVCNEIGASMSEVAAANLDELCGRRERGTLSGSGDNR